MEKCEFKELLELDDCGKPCVHKTKDTANGQDESAEEHKRKVVVTILYNSGEVLMRLVYQYDIYRDIAKVSHQIPYIPEAESCLRF
ncbi:hypothetical protein ACE6H2_001719 [Prunus campanulata]